ncbi:hypothetical protein ACIBEJ_47770 [Nonomuraea sp. NPDC050790]|uniref:hypothetical protein n=1 Tax=Nonomuraea sp. NPDC050790 TaxID=3364371 RepID=UPI0037B98F20
MQTRPGRRAHPEDRAGTADDPDTHEPTLALALHTLCVAEVNLGRHAYALLSYAEIVSATGAA